MTEPAFLRATRTAYDTVAADYAVHFRAELADKPLDRALLGAFAALVRGAGAGPVVDVGAGPGHVTARLRALGLAVSGVDLSPGMVAVARRAYPGLRFEVGSMTALGLPDGALGGVAALYSTIHLPDAALPGVFAEFNRVLAAGGQALLAILVGDGPLHRAEAFGHRIALDYYLRPPDLVADLLGRAGLVVHARLSREPGPGERVPRAFLLAGKPAPA